MQDARWDRFDDGLGQGLIEIIDVEDELALGGGESSDINQMTIAAGLHSNSRFGRPRQIAGHHRRRSAQECERGGEHTPVPDRYEVCQPRFIRFDQKIDRVGPILPRRPSCMLFAWNPSPQRSACFPALLPGNIAI
jgi:hypothetical protein